MKNLKRYVAITASLAVITTGGVAFGAGAGTPVEILSEITGSTVEELREERLDAGNPYGVIAEGYGVRDDFRAKMNTLKELRVAAMVESGKITQEQAELFLNRDCDDENDEFAGKELAIGFGKGLHKVEDGEGELNNKQTKQMNAQKELNEQSQAGGQMHGASNGQRKGGR